MSYSICVLCGEMVGMYQKFCEKCLTKYPSLKQVKDYWTKEESNEWKDERAELLQGLLRQLESLLSDSQKEVELFQNNQKQDAEYRAGVASELTRLRQDNERLAGELKLRADSAREYRDHLRDCNARDFSLRSQLTEADEEAFEAGYKYYRQLATDTPYDAVAEASMQAGLVEYLNVKSSERRGK